MYFEYKVKSGISILVLVLLTSSWKAVLEESSNICARIGVGHPESWRLNVMTVFDCPLTADCMSEQFATTAEMG